MADLQKGKPLSLTPLKPGITETSSHIKFLHHRKHALFIITNQQMHNLSIYTGILHQNTETAHMFPTSWDHHQAVCTSNDLVYNIK